MANRETILISITEEMLENIIMTSVKKIIDFQPQKELMNFKEACEFLNCSSSSLNRWKKEGRLPFKRLGGRIFFSRNEIISALEGTTLYKNLRNLR